MDFKDFKEKYQKLEPEEYSHSTPSQPLVSICVQTYQHASYIKDCLDSILIQETDFPFEILLGEDNSTDGTREICKVYAKKFPDKIRLFLHHRENNIKINGRSTGRFNFSYNLFSARGKYIAFCEGDDYWSDRKKLQKQIDFLKENKEFVLSYHDVKVVGNSKIEIPNSHLKHPFQNDLSQKQLLNSPFLLLCTFCFKNVFQDLPKEFFKVFNCDRFLISFLGLFGKGKYLAEIGPAAYRLHAGGMYTSLSTVEKELRELTTYFYLSNYHWRIQNYDACKCFRDISKTKCFYFLNRHFNWEEERRIFFHFLKSGMVKLSFYYALYKSSKSILNRGYFFRRKLQREIDTL